MKPEDITIHSYPGGRDGASGYRPEIRIGKVRFTDQDSYSLYDTKEEAEGRRREILAGASASKSEAVPWTDQQKSDWKMVERKLRDLNLAYENHEMLRSGEMVSGQPDASCRNERWGMVTLAHALALELTRCIAAEHDHET